MIVKDQQIKIIYQLIYRVIMLVFILLVSITTTKETF